MVYGRINALQGSGKMVGQKIDQIMSGLSKPFGIESIPNTVGVIVGLFARHTGTARRLIAFL